MEQAPITLDGLGRKIDTKDVATLFGVAESTIKSNYGDYGGVMVGRNVLFFENLISEKMWSLYYGDKDKRPVPPSSLAGKSETQEPKTSRPILPYKKRSGDVGGSGKNGSDRSVGDGNRPDDPFGVTA